MARLGILLTLAVAAAIAGVAWYVTPPSPPRGYAGVQFAVMTPAAAARAPLLTTRGALIYQVEAESPAAAAGLHAGEVVAAIDGVPINSADQAAGIVRAHRPGERASFQLFDEAKGDVHAKTVIVTFADDPKPVKNLSVDPPRVLAKEYFHRPTMAANSDFSRRIARGPTIRPLAMPGLGAGRCNGYAPEYWYVAAHDENMIHVMAPEGFQHAIFENVKLDGDPQKFVLDLISTIFKSLPTPAPLEPQPYGFTLFKFGTTRGAAGFAEYRVTGGRISVWIAAAASADIAWALPQAGAAAFSLHCLDVDGAPSPRDKALVTTSISTQCIQGKCQEGDFAAQYMSVLRLGYVHGPDGAMWLIKPKSDFWANGAEGPGYYHQIGGENEKLEPGRTN